VAGWSPYTGDAPESALRRAPEIPDNPGSGAQSLRIPREDKAWVGHPGRKLTVRKLMSSYGLAECGEPERMIEIFDDRILADGHLRDAFETREEDVAAAAWIVLPGSNDALGERVAQLVTEALREVPYLVQTLEHMSTALRYGYSYSEVEWRRVDGLFVPACFHDVWPGHFKFDPETDEPRLRTRENRSEGEPLRPGRWWGLWRRGRKKAMAGLMTTCALWSMFKTYGTRDWLRFMDRYGLPYSYASYKQLGPDERKDLKRMMQSLGTDGWAVFSDNVEVKMVEAMRAGKAEDVHGAMVALCNAEIAKLVTGSTIASEAGDNGSYALASEQGGRVFHRKLRDATKLAESFRDCVLRPFVQYNGFNTPPPHIKLHVVRHQAPNDRALTFRHVQQLGVTVSRQQVCTELQIQHPTGDDDELEPLPVGGGGISGAGVPGAGEGEADAA
jgi:phage gp29-like protein